MLILTKKNKVDGEYGAEQHQDVKLMHQRRVQITSNALFTHDFNNP